MASKSIYEAINTVREQVPYVQRDTNPNLRYSYVSEAGLIKALRTAMVKEGIISYVSQILDVREERYPNKETTMKNVSLTVVVTFYHVPSETSVDVFARGEGFDSGDKSTGKATTNATKYAMMKTFLLESGDDEIAEAVEELGVAQTRESLIAKIQDVYNSLKSNEEYKKEFKKIFSKYNEQSNPNLMGASDLAVAYQEVLKIQKDK